MDTVKLIYIIDDDPIFVFGLKKMFNHTGYPHDLRVFSNGYEAVAAIESASDPSQLPQVIFLDINMPIMNGWEFLSEFGKLDDKVISNSRIFLISSSIDLVDVERSRKIPIVERFLNKPVTLDDLRAIINLEPNPASLNFSSEE